MTGVHPADRGLGAVARVREVRETDSRIGLQQVLAEEAAAVGRLARLETHLSGALVPAAATPAQLMATHTALAHVGIQIAESRAEVTTASAVTAEARVRWGTDKARLAAVEHLLEARAARRRTEAARRADREADDLAAQAWTRAQGSLQGGHR